VTESRSHHQDGTTSKRQATIGQLVEAIPDARLVGNANGVVAGITYDSREVRRGMLFAALRGSDFDGHRYIHSALENGAAAILAEEPVEAAVPVILTGDSRASLAPLSAAFYGHPSRDLVMIGLTGTDGKTTTSYLVRHILRHAGNQTGMIGTVGIHIGDGTVHQLPHQTTPESNLVQGYLREMVNRGTECAVLEATSHGLAMHRLDGVHFGIAGVTNITHEHLEYHKTVENYRRAKAILVERVSDAGGVVVLNADDEGARSMAAYVHGGFPRWFSLRDSSADLYASDVVAGNDGSRFTLMVDGKRLNVSLPMLGEFNVENALCAIGVTMAAGVRSEVAIEGLADAEGVPGRMNRVLMGQPFNVVVDYAHTPESLAKILTLMRRLHPGGRVLVVSGSAGERDPFKRPRQGAVTAELADISIVTSEDPRNEDPDRIIREIADGAREKGAVDGASLFEITDRREAIRKAFSLAEPGDCVLLAGKGHETSIIWGFEHRPWNEAEVAREELRELGFGGEGASL
jgi:UDP-N-acetylmuramoyl-L-alanyl-D-glutamate--2,6-diaminopimelate ligase